MKNKKQFTLIELIIVIVVIGILAAMALPKFNGVVRNAKLSAMINDKEVLEKVLTMYYQKNDELPLLNEDEKLIIANEGISLSKIVLAEEVSSNDMDTIYKSLQKTLNHYNDSENNLYRIDLSKIKDNLGKDIKYGHKKTDKDFYVYSMKTGNVYYYDYLVNGNGTIQHTEYDTLLKENELVNKIISPSFKNDNSNNEDNISIQKNNIALGYFSTIKIGENGNLYSIGYNAFGQLGTGDNINKKTFEEVILPNNEKPISISVGTRHSMAITNKGNLYAWGNNANGQLGVNVGGIETTPLYVTLPNDEKPISISLGGYYSMAITDKGNLYAWGNNSYGQLGIENTKNQPIPQLVTLPNDEKPISIYTGIKHSMVITDKGNLYVWGNNTCGELGIGSTKNHSSPQKLILPNNESPIYIVLGENVSIVLTKKGNIYSWGDNSNGQLGLGDTINRTTPQLLTLPNKEKCINISLKYDYAIALTEKGNVYSWGYNRSGQLGIGNMVSQSSPQLVNFPNEEKFVRILSGKENSMAITNKNEIYVWGNNAYNELGIGDKAHQLTPIKIDLP